MPAEKRTPVILLNAENSAGIFGDGGDCLRFKLTVHYLNEDGELRNYLDGSGVRRNEDAFADLCITAQLDRSSDDPYGWSVEYRDIYSVNAERAEVMVKTLRKVNRGLEKMQAELGYAETFAGYVARVAKVLGVKTFMWRTTDRRGIGMYADNDYGRGGAEQLRWRISDAVATFKQPAQHA